MKQQTKQQSKQRYNLHYKVRKQGYRLHTARRTIYVSHTKATGPHPAALHKLLIAFGYALQTEIEPPVGYN